MHSQYHVPVGKHRCQRGLVQGYAMIPEGDEKAVMEAVYSRGPLAISLDASHDSFRFYASGM